VFNSQVSVFVTLVSTCRTVSRATPNEGDDVSSSTANSILGDFGFDQGPSSSSNKQSGKMWSLLFNLMNSIDDIDHSGMKNFKTVDIVNIPWWILPKGEIKRHEKPSQGSKNQRGGRKLKVNDEKDLLSSFLSAVGKDVDNFEASKELQATSEKGNSKLDPTIKEGELSTPHFTAKPSENSTTSESTFFPKTSIFIKKKNKAGAFRFGPKSQTKSSSTNSQRKSTTTARDGGEGGQQKCQQCHPFFLRDYTTCTPCVKIRRRR
jgi:hypothetical protein